VCDCGFQERVFLLVAVQPFEKLAHLVSESPIKFSAIKGVVLNPESVRSSLARGLGLEVGGLTVHRYRYVDGVAEMMLDATQKFKKSLTKYRLFDWHAHLFPGARTTSGKVRVGASRNEFTRHQVYLFSGPGGCAGRDFGPYSVLTFVID
jgi:hypothetical protein